jgi:hypothetical protein
MFPLRTFNALWLNFLLVRCIKRLKTSSGGLGGDFEELDQSPDSEKNRLPSNFKVKVEVEFRYQNRYKIDTRD